MWYVNVIESATGEIVKSIQCPSESKAEKVCDGVSINLDWDNYETQIEFKEEQQMTIQQAFNEAYSLLISGKACNLYRTDGVWYCSIIDDK